MIEGLEQFQYDQSNLIDGRYRPLRYLGEGATGAVLLVEDTTLKDRKLALKLLFPHLVLNEESLARFRNETRITMSLSHPNIVQTFGIGRHKKSFYYIKIEYIEGSSLRAYLDEQSEELPLELCISILFDIASALHYAHNRGVVHRDLKPENVILDASQHARLLDFGLAQTFDLNSRLTGVGAMLGTPYYMSPEQVRADILDRRTDIYSFGLLAYELLSGERAYDGDSLWEITEAQLHQDLPEIRRPDVPLWLSDCIGKCCRKERELRTPDFSQVAKLMRKHLHADIGSLPPETSGVRSGTRIQTVTDHRFIRGLRWLGSLWNTKNLWALLLTFIVGTLIALPHIKETYRWRYSIGVVYMERIFDARLETLRLILNIPELLSYPDSLFGLPSEEQAKKHGVPLHAADEKYYYRPYTRAGYELNYYDPARGTYPLHSFSALGNYTAVAEYIEQGANPNLYDAHDYRAIDYAARAPKFEQRSIGYLMRYKDGLDINRGGQYVESPLATLINRAKYNAAILLLEQDDIEIDIDTLQGEPLFFLAVRRGNRDFIEKLIDRDREKSKGEMRATLRKVDSEGRTALDILRSVKYLPNRREIEKLLLVDKTSDASIEGKD